MGTDVLRLGHSLVGNFVYVLPIGRGRAVGGDWGPAANALLGGWQVSGIVTSKSGFPWTIRGPDRSGTGSRGFRANRVGDGRGTRQVGPGTSWFDTAAFADPARGTFGNAGVGTVRGPRYGTIDTAIEKSFQFSESRRLQFRTEIINTFNSPIFNGGERNVTSTRFGEITSAQGSRRIQFGLRYEF